jgi:hypothetical protein
MSESGDRWREWFDRLGEAADVKIVNATANLVIAECDIHTAPLEQEVRRLSGNESLLLRAIEATCHHWNKTPSDYRTPLMQEAINQLSSAHQHVLKNTPQGG